MTNKRYVPIDYTNVLDSNFEFGAKATTTICVDRIIVDVTTEFGRCKLEISLGDLKICEEE